jgi:adenine/guanine phosphoribosyltransferase-like PRPP-binding protein
MISRKEAVLRRKFIKEAKVTNIKKGYVSAPWVNQIIDPKLQGYAADIIAHYFKKNKTKIDKVAGIPNMGTALASMVAERIKKPLALGRKGDDIPAAWKATIIINEDVPSFTTGKTSKFVFNGIMKEDTVLFVDDFIALGNTFSLIVKKFRQYGVKPLLATYCAKLFQPGVAKLKKIGIDPFYVVGIQSITPESIILTPRYF